MINIAQVFVGIDVSKKYLDVYIHPAEILLRIDNSPGGIAEMLKVFANYRVEIVGFESSGGYELLAKNLLEKANYKTWLIQPKRIKAFIYSEGINYKTDVSDAKMIALFVSKKDRAYEAHKPSESDLELKALVGRRCDLISMLNAEQNRLNGPAQLYCKKEIEKHVQFIKKQINEIDLTVDKTINNNSLWQRKAQILESVPGIGKITTATLLANVPELGSVSAKNIAALIGIAPFVKQSGTYKGKSVTVGGRAVPRKALYMATLVAVHRNEVFKKFYKRLVDAGKPKKVALVAAMRKLVVVANAMLKKNELWNCAVV